MARSVDDDECAHGSKTTESAQKRPDFAQGHRGHRVSSRNLQELPLPETSLTIDDLNVPMDYPAVNKKHYVRKDHSCLSIDFGENETTKKASNQNDARLPEIAGTNLAQDVGS